MDRAFKLKAVVEFKVRPNTNKVSSSHTTFILSINVLMYISRVVIYCAFMSENLFKVTLWSFWPVVLWSNVWVSAFVCIVHVQKHAGEVIHIPAAIFMLFRWSTVGGRNVPINVSMRQQRQWRILWAKLADVLLKRKCIHHVCWTSMIHTQYDLVSNTECKHSFCLQDYYCDSDLYPVVQP